MNKNYFRYLIRNRRILILFCGAVFLAVSLLWSLNSAERTPGYRFYSIASMAAVLVVGLSYVLPVLLFSFVHRRSSCDMYFSLPVSRREMRITSIAFAFAVIYGYFLITIVIAYVFCSQGVFPFPRLLALLGFGALMTLTLIVVHSAVYLLANTEADGMILLAAYSMLVITAFMTEGLTMENMIIGREIDTENLVSLMLSPIWLSARTYGSILSTNGWLYESFSLTRFLVLVIYAIAGWFGLRHEFDQRKTERAEMISDHPLAYPTVINLYAVLILLLLAGNVIRYREPGYSVLYAVLLACYAAGTFVYKRRLVPDWKMIGLFVGEAVLTLALMAAMWTTRGFGQADNYSLTKGETITYEYNMQTKPGSLGEIPDSFGTPPVYVSFELTFPVKDIENYREATDLLDRYRKGLIDWYYEYGGEPEYGYFGIYNTANGRNTNRYTYRPCAALSREDLITLNRYCDVLITDYSHDDWEVSDMPLANYLKVMEQLKSAE